MLASTNSACDVRCMACGKSGLTWPEGCSSIDMSEGECCHERLLSCADDIHKSSIRRYDRSRLKRPIGPTERFDRLLLVDL